MQSIERLRRTALALLMAGVIASTGCAATWTQKSAGEQIDDTVVTHASRLH